MVAARNVTNATKVALETLRRSQTASGLGSIKLSNLLKYPTQRNQLASWLTLAPLFCLANSNGFHKVMQKHLAGSIFIPFKNRVCSLSKGQLYCATYLE